ncbi:MAG: class I SAM-dependent methyltransferase [Candidatus Sifarchaeia archaeon]
MRLEQVINYVEDKKPGVFLEIGTWNGTMAKALLKLGAKKYIGFDLWEEGSEELDDIENNAKKRVTEEEVRERLDGALKTYGEGKEYELIKGNTRETLKKYVKDKEFFVDVCLIDGGHSAATIKNDFLNVLKIMKDDGVIFMDDYYFNCPTPGLGAQCVCAEMNVPYTVLPKVDKSRDGSLIKVVRIDMKDVPRMPVHEKTDRPTWEFEP